METETWAVPNMKLVGERGWSVVREMLHMAGCCTLLSLWHCSDVDVLTDSEQGNFDILYRNCCIL
jgi:hypothetical protein